MAKARTKKEPPPPDPAKLLPILEKMLDGKVHRLTGGRAPNGGVFTGGTKALPLISLAESQGYIEKRDMPAPPAARGGSAGEPIPGARITPEGRKWVADQLSPRKALEGLSGALQGIAGHYGKDTTGGDSVVQAQLGGLQHAMGRVLEAVREATAAKQRDAEQLSELLGSVRAVVELATSAPAAPALGTPDHNTGEPRQGQAELEADVLDLVRAYWREHPSGGMPLGDVYSNLRERHRGLTVGQFHDMLRYMHSPERRSLRLTKWSKAIEEIPVPEAALLVNKAVVYYASQP